MYHLRTGQHYDSAWAKYGDWTSDESVIMKDPPPSPPTQQPKKTWPGVWLSVWQGVQ